MSSTNPFDKYIRIKESVQKQKDELRTATFDFADHLYKKRKQKKLTMRQMANYLGICNSFYNDIEKGFRRPNLEIVDKIKKLFEE